MAVKRLKEECWTAHAFLRIKAMRKVVTAQAHQCTYQDPWTQFRCDKERFLHIHHKLPVAKGGTNALDNLTLLCSAHHRLEHYQSSG